MTLCERFYAGMRDNFGITYASLKQRQREATLAEELRVKAIVAEMRAAMSAEAPPNQATP